MTTMTTTPDLFLGCVADDFTGAGDAASFLVNAGISVILFNGIPENPPERLPQAIVIALKTRTAPVSEAVHETLRAARWLKEAGAFRLYLKYCSTFDSTREGNIGPTADSLMENFHIPYTLLCPSLPVNGRTVKDGSLYVNGIPLHQSSMGSHPLTPMWDCRIQVLMKDQSQYPVFPLTLTEMEQGGSALAWIIHDKSRKYKHFYLVPDYYEKGHGELIIQSFGSLPLLTGGSGLMGPIAQRYLREKGLGASLTCMDKTQGSAVLLAGSCSEMTLKQIACYQARGGVSCAINPLMLLEGRQKQEDLFAFLEQNSKNSVLFYSSAEPEKVRESQKAGTERISRLLETLMARLASCALNLGKKRIIVAGGETSGAVTKILGYQSYYIGNSIAPGVPIMIPCKQPDLRLVLKSGNFGQEDFFLKALEMTGKPE